MTEYEEDFEYYLGENLQNFLDGKYFTLIIQLTK